MSLSSCPQESFRVAMCPRLAHIVLTLLEQRGCANRIYEVPQHLVALVSLLGIDCHSLSRDECSLSALLGGWCDNKASISKRWGGGEQKHSWASPSPATSGQRRGGGRMHKSADARRPDTLQAVCDISWLLAVVGCDVCHGHDGWLSDLSHYIISVRNSLFLKCLFCSSTPELQMASAHAFPLCEAYRELRHSSGDPAHG